MKIRILQAPNRGGGPVAIGCPAARRILKDLAMMYLGNTGRESSTESDLLRTPRQRAVKLEIASNQVSALERVMHSGSVLPMTAHGKEAVYIGRQG